MITPARGGAAGTPWTAGPLRRPLSTAVFASLLAVTAGCGDDGGGSVSAADDATGPVPYDTGANPAGCVDASTDEVGDGADLFPDEFELTHAENLSLDYHGTYKVVTVGEPAPELDPQTYVLVQCGTDVPELTGALEDATVVEVPVRSLHSESTSHLGFIDELGITDAVTGVSSHDNVVAPSIRERIENGEVTEFATNYEVDTEVVVVDDPDVFVTAGTEQPGHKALADAGVPVLANAEWLEASPLGWAEWIGFFAALTNTEAAATEVFDGLEQRYDEVAAMAADIDEDERPSVITGVLVEGEWSARGGAGVVPQFIEDAGGSYVYADDTSTGTISLDIETVLEDGRDAEIWLSPNAAFTSQSDAASVDERYLEFEAWDRGGVWDNLDENDGVSRFEHGPVMIDVLLADYLEILQPDLAEDHDLVFFEEVE